MHQLISILLALPLLLKLARASFICDCAICLIIQAAFAQRRSSQPPLPNLSKDLAGSSLSHSRIPAYNITTQHNLKMQGHGTQGPSASTRFRYHRAKRSEQLPLFLHFKQEYQNRISEQKIKAIKAVFPHGVCGRNKGGQTVVVDRVGCIKMQGLQKVLEEVELVAYMNQRLLQLSERVLGEQDQLVWVVDLGGKIMQLASKKMLEAVHQLISNATTFFPNMLYKLLFVNTPMLFDTIWNQIAHAIPKDTQENIIMIADEIENIYEFAQLQILPDFLGGQLDEEDFLYGKREELQKQDESDQEQVDFSSLKQALGGLKIAAGPSANKSVLQTPLNTEADDK